LLNTLYVLPKPNLPQLLTSHSVSVLQLQQHDLRRIFHNLQVIPSNFQIRGMHTIIRDRTTSCADFVFYADRLLRLVVEAGTMRMQPC
jgi:Uracil phosphoribosyltransferase